MRKADFGLVVFSVDLKDNVSAIPLGLVFDKVEAAVKDMPHYFLTRHKFGNLLSTAVKVFETIGKHSAELIGTTLNIS